MSMAYTLGNKCAKIVVNVKVVPHYSVMQSTCSLHYDRMQGAYYIYSVDAQNATVLWESMSSCVIPFYSECLSLFIAESASEIAE